MNMVWKVMVSLLAIGQFSAWSAEEPTAIKGPGPDDKLISFTIPFDEKDCQAQALRNKVWDAFKKAKAEVEGQPWEFGSIIIATAAKPEAMKAVQKAAAQFKEDLKAFIARAAPAPEDRQQREEAEQALRKRKPNQDEWTREDFEAMNKFINLQVGSNWVEWTQDVINGHTVYEVVNTKKGAMIVSIGINLPSKRKLWQILEQDQAAKKF